MRLRAVPLNVGEAWLCVCVDGSLELPFPRPLYHSLEKLSHELFAMSGVPGM